MNRNYYNELFYKYFNRKIKIMFNFLTNTNVHIGNGSFTKFIDNLDKDDLGQILFVLDRGFSNNNYWINLKEKLNTKNVKVAFIYFEGQHEPTYDDLEEMLILAKKNVPDTIVSVGGGSCMDLAKAISCLLTNNGKALDYRGFDKLEYPGINTILVPTTAGTGSESSYNASFVDKLSEKKMGINGNFMFANKSILDSETLISCPKNALLGSAVDALTHALEGFICNNANEFSDMLAKKAFEYSINNINSVTNIKENLDSGLNLLKAAHLGGIIQMNSGSGIAAAISYPLSVHFKVPHGIGGGMFLLAIMKRNIDHGIDKYEELIPFLRNEKIQNSQELYFYMQDLFDNLGVPKNLSEFGINKSHKKKLCEIMKTQQLAFDQNPIKFSVTSDFENLINNYLE